MSKCDRILHHLLWFRPGLKRIQKRRRFPTRSNFGVAMAIVKYMRYAAMSSMYIRMWIYGDEIRLTWRKLEPSGVRRGARRPWWWLRTGMARAEARIQLYRALAACGVHRSACAKMLMISTCGNMISTDFKRIACMIICIYIYIRFAIYIEYGI